MKIFDVKTKLIQKLDQTRENNQSIGLVPTMGALHAGHISLVKKAVVENDVVVVSIFVNPTQFDNGNDLEKYPRTLVADIELLAQVSEKLIVFTPTKEDIYNGQVQSKEFDFDGLDKVMEGQFRDGHFDGVGTIVELLLTTVNPHKTYFGEKDFQQLQIIRKLVEQKAYPYEIIACPIEREPNGLAMSSRNERLSFTTRNDAGFIHDILKTAKKKFGTENALQITDWVSNQFKDNPLFDLEYFQIAEVESLEPIKEKEQNKKYRAFIAVYAEEVRLIDNVALN